VTDWTVEKLTAIATSYWDAAALAAAVELGVFEAIGARGAGLDEIAGRVGASQPSLRSLLDALAGMGLLRAGAGVYAIADSALPYLDPASPACLLEALRLNTDLYPLWGRLADCVRSGRPALPPGAHLGGDPSRTRRFVRAMHSRAAAMAPLLLPAIQPRDCSRLLDLASGPGTFSRLLAEKMPGLEVTLFDLPPVLAIARELSAGSPAAPRLRFHPGDYRRDLLPGGYDAVLFCGAMHQESPDSGGALLRSAAAALRPGGELLLVDMMLEKDRTAPAFSALFSLNMMLTSPHGRVFSETDLLEMLGRAGYCGAECRRLQRCPYWVIRATRP
jgi:SAM-dependent methyltransferase